MLSPLFIRLGRKVIQFFAELGNCTWLTGQIFLRIFRGDINIRLTIEQMVRIGVDSLAITLTTATFVGMVFAVQVVKEFLKFGAGKMIGGVVGLAMWRELAPLMTGVVIAGRVGAAISAEIGSMKVTEQVEALEALSQDKISYLVIPRFVACTVMMPLLVGLADIISFFGGYVVAAASGKINPFAYFDSAQTMLRTIDIYGGMIKSVFFGMVIAIIGCYMGLTTESGAQGVGISTTRSVVISLITIFILNYVLSVVIF